MVTTETTWDSFYLSKSNYSAFKSCPRRFYYGFVKREPPTPSFEMTLGINLHELIKKAYDNIKFEDNNVIFIEPKLENVELSRMYENFVKFEQMRYGLYKEKFGTDAPSKFSPLFTEHKIRNIDLKIVGVIDWLGLSTTGEYQVVDYKSSRIAKDKKKSVSDYKFELCMYKVLAEMEKKIDGEVKYGTIYFPDSNKVLEKTFTEKDIDWFFGELNTTMEQIKQCFDKNEWQCNTMFCQFCGNLDSCLKER